MEPKPEKTESQLNTIQQVHDCLDTLIGSGRCDGTQIYSNWNQEEEGLIPGGSMNILISINGQDTPELINIGYGRISHQTFKKDIFQQLPFEFKKDIFQQLPFDIYCSNSNKNYYEYREDKEKNPKKYLSKTVEFVANNGEIVLNPNIKDPIKAEYLITLLRNKIINTQTTPEEFSSFFQNLPDDIVELGEYFQKQSTYFMSPEFQSLPSEERMKKNMKIIRLRDILWGIGIDKVGVVVRGRESMTSIINLKKEFDFKQHRFIE